jgi:hypothetical protein
MTEQELMALKYDDYGHAHYGKWVIVRGINEFGAITFSYRLGYKIQSFIFTSIWAFLYRFNDTIAALGN